MAEILLAGGFGFICGFGFGVGLCIWFGARVMAPMRKPKNKNPEIVYRFITRKRNF